MESIQIRRTPTGRRSSATSVYIDPERFARFFWVRRIPLNQVGPMFGRCGAWASVAIHKSRVGLYAADELCSELEIHLDTFLHEVASDEELRRLEIV